MNITILTCKGRETVSKYRRYCEGISESGLMPNRCMLKVSIFDVNVGNSPKIEGYTTFISDINELYEILGFALCFNEKRINVKELILYN